MGPGFFRVHPPVVAILHSSPFRLSPCNQPHSFPQVCHLKPEFQCPAPACTSRHVSQAGECGRVARTICAGLFPFCLSQTGCCTLLWASEALFLSWLISLLVRGLPSVKEPFLFHRSHLGVQVASCFLFFLFSFVLPSYIEIFLALLGVWDLLLTLSRYSLRIVPHLDVFLMYLREELSSTSFYSVILIGPSPCFTFVWICLIYFPFLYFYF